MAEIQSLTAVLKAVDAGFTTTMKSAGDAVEQMTGKTQKAGSTILSTMKTMGWGMVGLGSAISAVGISAMKGYGQLEDSLTKAAVIAGGTHDNIQELNDVAVEMSKTLPISAQQSADAMVAMARDGASISDIKKEFPAIAMAASAAGEDISNTASVVQMAMNVWGKSLQSPAQAAAILTETANMSNASISSMQQAIANIGPTASQLGVSMQDVSTAVGLLTNKGFESATAATDLNFALRSMIKPSANAKAVMDELGLSFTDAQGNMKPLPEILTDINQKTDGMTKAQKQAALQTMFGAWGAKAMIPLLQAMSDKSGDAKTSWEAFSDTLEKTTGTNTKSMNTLKGQADEMSKSTGAKMTILKNSLNDLSNAAIQANAGPLGGLVDMLSKVAQWAARSTNPIAGFVRSLIGLAPVVGPVVLAMGGLLVALPLLVAGFKLLIAPIILSIGWIGKLTGIISPLGKHSKTAADGVDKFGRSTKNSGGFSEAAARKIKTMALAFMEVSAGVALASVGLAAIVWSISQLAQTGTIGAIELGIVAGALVVVSVSIAMMMRYLTSSNAVTNRGVKLMNSFGNAALKVGAAIGIAAAGIGLMAFGLSSLASQGNAGLAVIITMAVAIGALVAVFAIFGPVLDASALGIAVFAAALVAGSVAFLIFSKGVKTVVDSVSNGLSTVLKSVAKVIDSVGEAALKGGRGFKMLAQGVVAITNTKLADMAASLSAVGRGIGKIASHSAGISTTASGMTKIKSSIAGMSGSTTIAASAATKLYNALKKIPHALNGSTINSAMAQMSAAIVARGALMVVSMTLVMTRIRARVVAGMNASVSSVRSGGSRMVSSWQSAGNRMVSTTSSFVNRVNSSLRGIGRVSLYSNGVAVMSSFESGLDSVWARIQAKVSSMAGWIKAHKGPISYDKTLLVENGQAIMQGLNVGITGGFENVQDNISTMAERIRETFNASQAMAIPTEFSNMADKFNDLSINGGSFNSTQTINATSDIEVMNNKLLQELVNKRNDIYLDGEALVGGTMNRMNTSLGNATQLKGRWI